MISGIQAVLFDLDGVLVDSELLANHVWVALLAEHGLPLTPQAFMRNSVGLTHQELYARLSEQHGWTPPDGFPARTDAALAQSFERVPALPGAAVTLAALRDAGVPYAVASNSRRDRLDLKLSASGLQPLVPYSFDPEQVGGRGKPLPDLYLHAAQALGVDVRQAVVIEDSSTGVRAGVAAGATVWGLLAGGHTHDALPAELLAAGASRLLHSHAELLQALRLPAPATLPG
ncbi:HAD family hydrolase [Deinococcus aquiradiocola]|uniref:Beta-phosphoglucomutase n=1 Tax=Deinococcus aquiradiocola TaxID=393059 RepID=A0A917P4F2_9DEIO|nr:HAD family phosphatase [Deinococcus aquiradiocola]GGJ61218.1 beta-phosphoglucomutase [Deinococcus aquiradiocola]